jgi:hypothetical protein
LAARESVDTLQHINEYLGLYITCASRGHYKGLAATTDQNRPKGQNAQPFKV